MAVTEGQARVRDKVGQAVSAAQQALLAVGRKALLSALDGGVQGQSGRAVWLVLQQFFSFSSRSQGWQSLLTILATSAQYKESGSHLLEPLLQSLDLVLLALGKSLALAARGQASNISLGGIHGGEGEGCSKSSGCQS